ncbi:MAG: hypothetical protein ACOC0P_05965, partial [Planctomycetota bacterium]
GDAGSSWSIATKSDHVFQNPYAIGGSREQTSRGAIYGCLTDLDTPPGTRANRGDLYIFRVRPSPLSPENAMHGREQ